MITSHLSSPAFIGAENNMLFRDDIIRGTQSILHGKAHFFCEGTERFRFPFTKKKGNTVHTKYINVFLKGYLDSGKERTPFHGITIGKLNVFIKEVSHAGFHSKVVCNVIRCLKVRQQKLV